jgi:hypothetical protein
MDEDDIKTLTREGRQNDMVPLSPTSVRLLIYLKQLVMDNIEKDVPDAELPTTYTKEMYTKYVIKIKLEKRKKKNAHRGGGRRQQQLELAGPSSNNDNGIYRSRLQPPATQHRELAFSEQWRG